MPEYGWLYGELKTEEIQQLNNLDLYLDANTTTEATSFGLEAIPAFMAGGEVDFEEQVINNLEGKAKCVYELLKSTNGHLYKSTLGVFDQPNSKFCVEIKRGTCNSLSDNACTNGSDVENGIINIKIQSFGNSTLDLAATILHEGIHAEIYKYVYEYQNGLDPENRKDLLYWYFTYKAKNELDLGTTKAQHQYMADNFVKPIAKAIWELDNKRFDIENYMGFGWDGLRAYGYAGYYDNGILIKLDKGVDTEYYLNQKKILETTSFNKNCEL